MVLVLLMTLLSIKMIDTLIRTLQRRTVIRSIINMPQNATPSFTIVISCDSCMFTNPNVDVQVKKKKRSDKAYSIYIWLRETTNSEEFSCWE